LILNLEEKNLAGQEKKIYSDLTFKGKPQRTPKNKEHMESLTLLEAY
jgi:hypothetical protein